MASEDRAVDQVAEAGVDAAKTGAQATGRAVAGGVRGAIQGGAPGAVVGAVGGAASAIKPRNILIGIGAGVLVIMLLLSSLVGVLFNTSRGGLEGTAGAITCFIDDMGSGGGGGYDGPIPAGLNPEYIGKPGEDGIPREAIPWIAEAVEASKEKIPASFFAAMMRRESDFRPNLFAHDKNGGTWGLTQINQSEWNRLYGSSSWDEDRNNNGTRDISDPDIHMQISAKLTDENFRKVKALREKNPGAHYVENMDIWQHIAAAHNAGFTGSQRKELPSITKSYIAEIKKHMEMWAGEEIPEDPSQDDTNAPKPADAMAGGTVAGTRVLAAPADEEDSEEDGEVVAPMLKGQYRVTSGFGPRNVPGGSRNHQGIDLASKTPGKDATGLAIVAIADGKVHLAGPSGTPKSGFGQRIVLEHSIGGQTVSTLYGHMYDAQKYVKPGQTVKKGQQIAEVGSYGSSTAAHLHFEVWPGKYQQTSPVDPVPWLKEHGATDLPGARPGPGPDDDGHGGGDISNIDCKPLGSGTDDGDTGGPDQPGDGTEIGQKILEYAKAELGKPYRYGAGNQDGPGPGGTWDCSGLTTYAVYHGTGKNTLIPRTAAGQEGETKQLKTIEKKDLKPGDIVTMRKKGASGAHHTGLYWGDGQIIHAPSTGDVVKISKMSAWDGEILTFKKVPGNE